MLKGPIILLKIMRALLIKENIHNPVYKPARVQCGQVAKMAGKLVLVKVLAKPLQTYVF